MGLHHHNNKHTGPMETNAVQLHVKAHLARWWAESAFPKGPAQPSAMARTELPRPQVHHWTNEESHSQPQIPNSQIPNPNTQTGDADKFGYLVVSAPPSAASTLIQEMQWNESEIFVALITNIRNESLMMSNCIIVL